MFWKENQEEKDTTDRRGRWLIASSRGTPCPRCRAPPAPPGAASEPRPPPSSQPRLPVPPPWGIADIRGWITSGATRHLTRHPFGAGSPPPPDPSQRRPSRRAALGLTPPAARLERSWRPSGVGRRRRCLTMIVASVWGGLLWKENQRERKRDTTV